MSGGPRGAHLVRKEVPAAKRRPRHENVEGLFSNQKGFPLPGARLSVSVLLHFCLAPFLPLRCYRRSSPRSFMASGLMRRPWLRLPSVIRCEGPCALFVTVHVGSRLGWAVPGVEERREALEELLCNPVRSLGALVPRLLRCQPVVAEGCR